MIVQRNFKLLAFLFLSLIFYNCTSPDQNILKIDFTSDTKRIYEASGVNYNLISHGAISECTWFFEGGEPEYYNQANPPTVYYGKAGKYSVTLNVIANGQKQVINKENFILVQEKPDDRFRYLSINAEKNTIKPNESIEVWVVAIGENLEYEWNSNTGSITGEGAQVEFATGNCFEGEAEISSRVSNEFGTMERSIKINVVREE